MENQLVKIVNESGLEKTKADLILKDFQDYFAIAADWECKAKAIVVKDESQKAEMKMAREGRLFLKEKRVAVEKRRKELKAQSVREGNAIDGIANVLKALITPIEEYLERQEKFLEIKEAERIESRYRERLKIISDYPEEINSLAFDIKNMDEDSFSSLVEMAKISKSDKAEKERKAEEARILKEKKERTQTERRNKMFELGLKFNGESFLYEDINFHWTDLLCMTDEKFNSTYEKASIRKAEIEKEKAIREAKIRAENERLQKEAEERDRIAEAEREKAAEEKKKQEELIAKERAEAKEKQRAIEEKAKKEREKLKAELKAKQDKEDAELRAKEEAERKEKEEAERLAAADDKTKLLAFHDAIYKAVTNIKAPEVKSKKSLAIYKEFDSGLYACLDLLKSDSEVL